MTPRNWGAMILALKKAIAMYELLHAHARGQTDLTEDQLASVVTGIAEEARETLSRAEGPDPTTPISPHRLVSDARGRVSGAGYGGH